MWDRINTKLCTHLPWEEDTQRTKGKYVINRIGMRKGMECQIENGISISIGYRTPQVQFTTMAFHWGSNMRPTLTTKHVGEILDMSKLYRQRAQLRKLCHLMSIWLCQSGLLGGSSSASLPSTKSWYIALGVSFRAEVIGLRKKEMTDLIALRSYHQKY